MATPIYIAARIRGNPNPDGWEKYMTPEALNKNNSK
jgi:hypothetical protein